jgi:hypothetical protein
MEGNRRPDAQIIAQGIGAVVELAKTTINSLVLANGGAAIALLSLISQTKGDGSAPQGERSLLVLSLSAFTIGVAITLIAAGLTYLSNYRWLEAYQIDGPGTQGPIWRKMRVLRRWSVLFAAVGLILFVLGMGLGAFGFLGRPI